MMDNDLYFLKMHRGWVVDNYDPKVKGRVKIFVPGIYPDEYKSNPSALPWAEPIMPIFGGSGPSSAGGLNSETGVSSPPHVDAQMLVFFEAGNHLYPRYWAASQSGDGWLAEHNNQHVIKTDNVRIRVDERPTDSKSTCQFDTYNANCTYLSQPQQVQDQLTTLDIECTGNVHIRINGDVNMQVNGNVFEEINGDKHETVNGNWYRQHNGDMHIVHNGNTLIEQQGDTMIRETGNRDLVLEGNKSNRIIGNNTRTVTLNENITVATSQTSNITQRTLVVQPTNNEVITGIDTKVVTGVRNETVGGTLTVTVLGLSNHIVTGLYTLTSQSSIIEQAPSINLN